VQVSRLKRLKYSFPGLKKPLESATGLEAKVRQDRDRAAVS